jgi:hypothetical protein
VLCGKVMQMMRDFRINHRRKGALRGSFASKLLIAPLEPELTSL